jgi:hypothetical protein
MGDCTKFVVVWYPSFPICSIKKIVSVFLDIVLGDFIFTGSVPMYQYITRLIDLNSLNIGNVDEFISYVR